MTRQCFYIPVEQFDEHGYIPSVVFEGEPGHSPLTGNGEHATPWHWGKTYEEAVAHAANANAEMGLSPKDVADILASSIFHVGQDLRGLQAFWVPGGQIEQSGPVVTIPLRIALDWFMVSDPTPLTREQDEIVHDALNEASAALGYSSWIDAYHLLGKDGPDEVQPEPNRDFGTGGENTDA